jgi:hypothetical protein
MFRISLQTIFKAFPTIDAVDTLVECVIKRCHQGLLHLQSTFSEFAKFFECP